MPRERGSDLMLLILRVVVGGFLMAHGAHKVPMLGEFSDALAKKGFPAPDVFAFLAMLGELGGGLSLLLGALTRLGAFGAATVMLVAVLSTHLGDAPNIGGAGGSKFEYPFLLMVAALVIGIGGPGRFSLDALWHRLVRTSRADG